MFGLTLGGCFFSNLATFALGIWFGTQCVLKTDSCSESISRQEYTAGIVFTVFFSIIALSFHLSHLPFNLKKLMEGIVAI